MEKLLFTGETEFLGRNVRPVLEQHYEETTCEVSSDDIIRTNLAKELSVLPQNMILSFMHMVRLIWCQKQRQRSRLFMM